MQQGDFTNLAQNYINRPAYSKILLKALIKYIEIENKPNSLVADVGAGTGKFTKMLLENKLKVVAVEPNDAMRKEGNKYTKDFKIDWIEGSGEKTNLPDNSVDWIIMASSFHWTDPKLSLPEFHRILKDNGFLTIVWNPRNIEDSNLQSTIENNIFKILPNLKRVSSGSSKHTKKWNEVLVSTGHFKDVIFMEVDHLEIMSKKRYIGAWNSVNDIRAQASENEWRQIIEMIQSEIKDLNEIEVLYKNRAWTSQKKII